MSTKSASHKGKSMSKAAAEAASPEIGSVKSVPLSELLVDPRLQLRENSDAMEEAVDRYVDALDAGEKLPPIEVFEVPEASDDSGAGVFVVEGHLRLDAHAQKGETHIECRLVGSGTFKDAMLKACGANSRHGLPRTSVEIRKAVQLARKLMGKRASVRAVGAACGVSGATVSRIENPPKPKPAPAEPTVTLQQPEAGETGPSHDELDEAGESRPEKPEPQVTGHFQAPTLTDANGVALPEEFATLCADFEARKSLRMAAINLKQAMDAILEGRNQLSSKDCCLILDDIVNEDLSAVITKLDRATPHAICPKCKGEGCSHCHGNGWLTK